MVFVLMPTDHAKLSCSKRRAYAVYRPDGKARYLGCRIGRQSASLAAQSGRKSRSSEPTRCRTRRKHQSAAGA